MKPCRLFCFSLLSLVFFSCSSPRYVHTPVTLNTPYFQQKHDSKVAGFTSSGASNNDTNYVRGYDLMAAYAVSDHVAITGSYFRRNERDNYSAYPNDPFDSSVVNYKRSGWDIGGGYFLPLDKRKSVMASFYGGFGQGSFSIFETGRKDSSFYTRNLHSRPFKFYIQPGIYLISPVVKFSFSLRYNFVRYNNLSTDYSTAEAQIFHLDRLNKKTLAFQDLAFGMQLLHPKFPGLAVEGQLSFSTGPVYYYAHRFNASAGLVINLYRLLKNNSF